MKKSPEIADIFRTFGPAYRQAHGEEMSFQHLRAMRAIEACRTPRLGGHLYECDHCGELTFAYHSCRNRHCPTCQFLATQRWIQAREQDLLPIPYFHAIFTLPEQLRPIALRNQKTLYSILFKAASGTLKELAADPKHLGANIGFIAILHTWSQTLLHHPHLHCIVTGGGLSPGGKEWISTKNAFFVHVKVLARLFRGKFLAFLKDAYDAGELTFPGKIAHLAPKPAFNLLLSNLYRKQWNVYCQPPFGGPQHVIQYLGAYTHRIAISNSRLVKLEKDRVTFQYRDSEQDNRTSTMTLPAFGFIRRFLLHILPCGFVRIRYYGILANRHRKTSLALCRNLLHVPPAPAREDTPQPAWQDLLRTLTGIDPTLCTHCGKGNLIFKQVLLPKPQRAPPHAHLHTA